MPHLVDRREVDRYYDLERGDLVIVNDVEWKKWNEPLIEATYGDGQSPKTWTTREEKRVKLTLGEIEYLRDRELRPA